MSSKKFWSWMLASILVLAIVVVGSMPAANPAALAQDSTYPDENPQFDLQLGVPESEPPILDPFGWEDKEITSGPAQGGLRIPANAVWVMFRSESDPSALGDWVRISGNSSDGQYHYAHQSNGAPRHYSMYEWHWQVPSIPQDATVFLTAMVRADSSNVNPGVNEIDRLRWYLRRFSDGTR